MKEDEIRKLHDEAMTCAQLAEVAKIRGNLADNYELLMKAFEKESQAALLISNNPIVSSALELAKEIIRNYSNEYSGRM